MIYCNLRGGLGNMLFQISASLSFAIDLDTECSFPNLDTHLAYLNNDNTYNPKLKHSFTYKSLLPDFKTTPPINISVCSFPFEYKKIDIGIETIIDGFFQSEKYFSHNRAEILKILGPKEFITEIIDREYGDLLKKRTSSIHVRRGDYVNHPNHHPVQDIEYYKKGIDILKDDTDVFLIFSDDITWCKENISTPNSVYIENQKDYIELYLMARCNNNIIANSSFSWWGAWLNTNENKKVIGPEKWFGPAIKEYAGDILPDTWIKI